MKIINRQHVAINSYQLHYLLFLILFLYFQLEEGLVKEDNEVKDEPDFIETHCHWKECDRDYGTQDELVKVSSFVWRRFAFKVNCS